jgi:hypothetical protein
VSICRRKQRYNNLFLFVLLCQSSWNLIYISANLIGPLALPSSLRFRLSLRGERNCAVKTIFPSKEAMAMQNL